MIEFIKLRSSQYDITLSIHSYNFLCVFPHEEMFTKNYIIKDAPSTKNIANWMRFSRHILYVYNLRSHISWSSTTNKKIVGIISNCSQPKVNHYWLFTQNNIVWLEITMDYIFSGHLCQSS